jgi:YHS domain-containing protein
MDRRRIATYQMGNQYQPKVNEYEKQKQKEREKKEREEKEKEGAENNEEIKEGEGEEQKEVKENKEEGDEIKEGEGEEEKKEEENKEGEGEEQKEGEEKKEDENKEEQKEENKNEELKISSDRRGSTARQLNSDRTSVIKETSSNDKQNNQNEEFKNLVIDKDYIQFHFLNKEEEVNQFLKCPDDFQNYILKIRNDIIPPKILSFERIAEILYKDEEQELDENEEESENQDSKEEDSEMAIRRDEVACKFSLNVKYEYQDCCPVDIVENRLQRIGKLAYSVKYNGKYYKFSSMENMLKFKMNPSKYINLDLPVRKVNQEHNILTEKQIMFNNTVNFLEFTFGSLITKGMLELSNNRIKYPYLNVKESSLKYLALYLKANNPKNNKYAMEKYKKILKDFIRNSELPWELYHVYENYKKEKDNVLNKKLIRKQLDTVSVKYDKLMEKAKIQNNTRFANFFKISSNEANEEEKNE